MKGFIKIYGICNKTLKAILEPNLGIWCNNWKFREGYNEERTCINCRFCNLTHSNIPQEYKTHNRGGIRKRPGGFND